MASSSLLQEGSDGCCEGFAAGFVRADGQAGGDIGDVDGVRPSVLEYVGAEPGEGWNAGYLLRAGVSTYATTEGKAR